MIEAITEALMITWMFLLWLVALIVCMAFLLAPFAAFAFAIYWIAR